MAHQVAVPHPSGALASLVDGFTNNAMAIYEMGPSAAAIEFLVLNWMIGKVGWTPDPVPAGRGSPPEPHAGGVLTHGGSLANLTALLAARSAPGPDAWERGTPVRPRRSRARRVALLDRAGCGYPRPGTGPPCTPLEVDADGTDHPGPDSPRACEECARDGRRPMALVANACSTALGLYDPLREIGGLCRERRMSGCTWTARTGRARS